MESLTLNNVILIEELVSVALLEEGFNVARPVRIGPIDLLSIRDGGVIKRLQVKSCSKRSKDHNMRYEFKVSQAGKNYSENDLDFIVLVGVETKSFWVVPFKKIETRLKINTTIGGNGAFDRFFGAFKLLR